MKKAGIIVWIIFIMTLISPVAAQDYAITISPSSSPPGTVVTITPNQTYADARCFANSQQLPGYSYTVPGNASGTIIFYCEAGTGEFHVRSNDAVFSVVLPDSDGDGVPDGQDACPNEPFQSSDGCPPSQPEDSDGDGVPDGQDACPNQPFQSADGCPLSQPEDSDGDGVPDGQDACPFVSGRGDQFGGVTGVDGCPVDSDGDGINDGLDQCPFDAAPGTGSGCPADGGGQASPPASPSPSATEAPALPDLPADGACYVATQGAIGVNVRELPNLDASIIGGMDPYTVYTVSLRYNDGSIIWYRLDDLAGWAAGSVTRQSQPCNSILWGTPDGELDTGRIQLADMDYDNTFSECPELADSVTPLPNYIIGYILDATDSCAAASILLENLLFDDLFTVFGPTGISYDAINDMLANCPARVPGIIGRLRNLYDVSPDAFAAAATAVESQRCAVDLDAALPDDFLSTRAGMEFALRDRCGFSSEDSARIADRFADSGAPAWSPGARFGFCESAEALALIGPVDTDKQAFLDLLEETCGFEPMPLGILLLNAAQENMYPLEQLTEDIHSNPAQFCDNPFSFIEEHNFPPEVAGTDPYWVPPALQSCPDIANRLREYRDANTGTGISLADLAGILQNSHDPCAAGQDFLRTGQAPPPPADFTDPECVSMNDAGYTVTFEGSDDEDAPRESRISVTVDDSSSWGEMLMALDQLHYRGCDVESPSTQFRHGLSTRACYYVSYWFQADYPRDLTPRGMYVDLSIWSRHGAYGQLVHTAGPIRHYFTGHDPFHITSYVWMRDVDTSTREAFVTGFTHNYESLVEVHQVRQYGIPVGIVNEVRDEFCQSDVTPVPYRESYVRGEGDDVGGTSEGLAEEDSVGQADDSVAVAAGADDNENGNSETPPVQFATEIEMDGIIAFEFVSSEEGDVPPGEGAAGSDEPSGDGAPAEVPPEAAVTDLALEEAALPTADELPEGVSPDELTGGVAIPEPVSTANVDPQVNLPTDPETLAALLDTSPALRGARGIFQAVADDQQQELYALPGNGAPVLLTGNFDMEALLPAIAPSGNRLVFIGENAAGERSLFMFEAPGLDNILIALSQGPGVDLGELLIGLNVGPYTVLPYQPVWLPDGGSLLVTLAGEEGMPGIYQLNPAEGLLELVIDNATSPTVDPKGRIVGFVRETNGVANIYSASLANRRARPVTKETAAPGCTAPAFGDDPFAMYFLCGEVLYRYDVKGANPIGLPGVISFVPGPSADFVTFSDGDRMYLLNEETGTTSPLTLIEDSSIQAISWVR